MRSKALLGLSLLILVFMIQPVNAQTNSQGLIWGFAVGDIFQYNWTISSKTSPTGAPTSWSGRISIEVLSLPNIPSVVDYFIFMNDMDSVSKHFANGSAIPISTGWEAVPIGNWSLINLTLSEIMQNADIEEFDTSFTSTAWMVDYTLFEPDYTENATLEYSLADGVMSYYHFQRTYNDSTFSIKEFDRLEPSIFEDPLVLASVIAVTVFVVVGLAAIRYRRK